MANPYKKEVKKVPPGGKPKQEEEKVVVEEPTPPVENDNPLAGLVEPKSKNGKACGFYLSEEATDKLEKLAKQNKCSKSKALDALLRSL